MWGELLSVPAIQPSHKGRRGAPASKVVACPACSRGPRKIRHMQHTRYEKPPIVEAVIDIQVRPADGMTLDDFKKWGASLETRFPVSAPIMSMTLKVPEPGAAPEASNDQVGVRLATADNSRVVMIQQRGFTFSQLTQYTCWEDFSAEARTLWEQYSSAYRLGPISRVATRFINKIVIPEREFELEDYFNLRPTFPRQVNDVITGVFMQLRQPVPMVPNALATINFSSVNENVGTPAADTSFLLDFDVAVEGAWDTSGGEVWDILAEFRRVKNLYFESSITDACRRLFK